MGPSRPAPRPRPTAQTKMSMGSSLTGVGFLPLSVRSMFLATPAACVLVSLEGASERGRGQRRRTHLLVGDQEAALGIPHNIAGGPYVLHPLDAVELVDGHEPVVPQHLGGQVLGVGQHAHGGEIQVRDQLLAVLEDDLGAAVGKLVVAVDAGVVLDLDAELGELALGVGGDGVAVEDLVA